LTLVSDARSQTKTYLTTYLRNAQLTKDDDATQVSFAIIYANPDYRLTLEFYAPYDPVDLLYVIGTPNSTPLMDPVTQKPYGYEEHVPIEIVCIDKTGITGTKLRWKAEAELRYVTETYPTGSLRSLERMGDNDQNLGSTILYSAKYILNYRRDPT